MPEQLLSVILACKKHKLVCLGGRGGIVGDEVTNGMHERYNRRAGGGFLWRPARDTRSIARLRGRCIVYVSGRACFFGMGEWGEREQCRRGDQDGQVVIRTIVRLDLGGAAEVFVGILVGGGPEVFVGILVGGCSKVALCFRCRGYLLSVVQYLFCLSDSLVVCMTP